MYCAYGLQVSASRPIPGLRPAEGLHEDVRIRLNEKPEWLPHALQQDRFLRYESLAADEGLEPCLRVWELRGGDWRRLQYFDGFEFILDRNGREVWCTWPENARLEDASAYLLGPVLGLILRLRGICCLHASAVMIGDSAVALAGPSQAGKSSTAAAFATLGYPVLSDDIVALKEEDGSFMAQPGYPRLCLWPDVIPHLGGCTDTLPRIAPEDGISAWWDKRYLDLNADEYRFHSRPAPLKAIYLLRERAESGQPAIEEVSSTAALTGLVAGTYMNYLLDREQRAKEFATLGRLVATTPVRSVTAPEDASRLAELCEAIVRDVGSWM